MSDLDKREQLAESAIKSYADEEIFLFLFDLKDQGLTGSEVIRYVRSVCDHLDGNSYFKDEA